MPNFKLNILELYHIFGLTTLFIFYLLILSFSYKKKTLWYGTFILSIALEALNPIGLYSLFKYSPNFTLAYLPWSLFMVLALYKHTIISCDVNTIASQKKVKIAFVILILFFSYFFIKSYWILLGSLELRDQFFYTTFKYPLVEFWIVQIAIILTQWYGIMLSYSILKGKKTTQYKDSYLLLFTQICFSILILVNIIKSSFTAPTKILSAPINLNLTVIISLALILAYRKIIGINYEKESDQIIKAQTKPVGLDIERMQYIEDKLLAVMDKNQLYKNSKLQLRDISNAISIQQNQISEVLAQRLNTNYYDFINEYRVKEVIKLMGQKKYQDYKLLIIAKEAGFNSKTTFNTAFKKVTNQTPSVYKKTHCVNI